MLRDGPVGHPKVCVVIPAYNAESTIARAIESVCRQTYDNWEVVVVDDGSDDGTSDVACRYPHTTVIRQPNAGPTKARDRGVEATDAEFVAMLDADDECHRERLQIQLAVLQALERKLDKPVLLCTGRYLVYPDGTRRVAGGWSITGEVRFTDRDELLEGRSRTLLGATLMMRRQAYLDLDGQACGDAPLEADFYHRAANMGWRIAHVGLPLYIQHVSYSSHSHQLEARVQDYQRLLLMWSPRRQEIDGSRAIPEAVYSEWCRRVYRYLIGECLRRGDTPRARALVREALLHGPISPAQRLGLWFPFAYRCAVKLRGLFREARLGLMTMAFERKLEANGGSLANLLSHRLLEHATPAPEPGCPPSTA